MNTKARLVLTLLILALAFLAYFFLIRERGAVPALAPVAIDEDGEDTGFRGDPSGGTYIFDEGPITLSQGRAEQALVPGSALVEEVYLTGQAAYGDINADNKSDAALIVVRSGGGSGSFVYVAALVSRATRYTGSNAVFIGDRVSPNSISISGGIITVEYLDRGPDEAMAAEPTIAVVKRFVYRDDKLIEI